MQAPQAEARFRHRFRPYSPVALVLVSPVFVRELVTAPRRPKHYVARATYVAAVLMLMGTAWLVVAGTQAIGNIGDLARFGSMLFQILAPLQLTLAVFFAALFTASSVSQEKDRRTLILLLVTDLSNFELVVGKLLASMLNVLVLILAALPLFTAMVLLGGVDLTQVLLVFAVTLFSALAAGSLGSTMALWREKTFQALALTALVLVAWVAAFEVVAWLPEQNTLAGLTGRQWAVAWSPWRAVLEVAQPTVLPDDFFARWLRPGILFLPISLTLTVLLNAVAVGKVRVWNPSREVRRKTRISTGDEDSVFTVGADVPQDAPAKSRLQSSEGDLRSTTVVRSGDRPQRRGGDAPQDALVSSRTVAGKATVARHRQVWSYPVLWREVRTWAYGRKTLALRCAYLVLSGCALAATVTPGPAGGADRSLVALPFFLLSLVLINAQAVTSISTERDGKTLDLLLVTDLSPREFVLGKLGGVFYNTKEMVLVPLLYCVVLRWQGVLSAENVAFVIVGLLVMDGFVAVLGIHCGLIHGNSRVAVATSLGTVFFLFVGIATCMRIMVAFSGSFGFQLAPFLAFMLGGGVALYVSLGARHASTAIFCAAFTRPFLTFWAITSYLQNHTLGPFLVISLTYLFTTLAMLVPALSEFDVVSGRATED